MTCQAATHFGRFWTPERPDHSVFGRITVGPGVGPILTLHGILWSSQHQTGDENPSVYVERLDLDAPPLTLHGELFDTNSRVTLIKAQTVHHSLTEQTLEAAYALVGGHVPATEAVFDELRLRLRYQNEWAGTRPLVDQKLDGTWVLNLKAGNYDPGQMKDGGTVNLLEERSLSSSKAEVRVTKSTSFRVEVAAPASWSYLDRRIVTPLSSLLTLAVGKYCGPVQVQLHAKNGEWLDMCAAWVTSEPTEVADRHQMLLPHGDITMADIARWLDRTQDLTPFPAVVADSISKSSWTLEPETLNLCTVAEGLHSRLRSNETAIEADQAQKMPYRRRMKELGNAAESAAPGITGDTERWAKAVTDTRNVFAHRSKTGFLSHADVDQHLTVLSSMQWVLRILLLQAAGVENQVIARRLAANQSYRLFREECARRCPDIYGPHPQSDNQ